MNTINAIRREVRAAVRGRSLTWVAKECGVSKQYLHYFLRAGSSPSLAMCEKIADKVGCTIEVKRNGR